MVLFRPFCFLSVHASPPPPPHSSKRVFFTSGLLDKINNDNNVRFCFHDTSQLYSFYWAGRSRRPGAEGRQEAEAEHPPR